ncbi:cobyrinate a,c-diamide synthase [Pseudobacteroides cellulosolvens]|uniref:Cobyrinate a,c-diamide synthase n=1 Tax=Pseudobacteroides cellulosolvens ATCC 35603 = DSM 2933 TaxID=398512 RepID=A0A0L6JQD1_9FIRM|nr:cobyrinate a,c-diamide synthase [Pseudobacteroides cellulosolvens]KNY27998.1 Cobyrinic acid A,C-diamide synthase [Pseudobacteroides cellulosolvens ATCC 35603 = DSM 2933]
MKIPRLVIAGTNSGCGKTTVSTGLMAAMLKRGLVVQPYKVGPDYIDPMFHTFITGRNSRNLDSWLLDSSTVSYLLRRSFTGADIAIVEGVMGLYDGFGGNSIEGSTAHVSKIIKAPVVLVVNGEGMSLSIAALVKGFVEFNRETAIKGVIINNITSKAHYIMLKDIIEEWTGIKAIGYLKRNEEWGLQSRHLGLVPSDELEGLKTKLDSLADEIMTTIDLDALINIANDTEEICMGQLKPPINIITPGHLKERGKVRIAVAMDKAFNFYYKDNLDLLEMLGAELVYFSPLKDKQLPHNIDGLYLGGGYPEVWAHELEKNSSLMDEIKTTIEGGIPAYAECGGLMYLTDTITDNDGNCYKMAGVVDAESKMTQKLQRFGYVEVEIKEGSVLSEKGCRVRAHEFHYSQIVYNDDFPDGYKVYKPKTQKVWNCGYRKKNLIAGYPHIHFWSDTGIAAEFIKRCMEYKVLRKGEKKG